MGNVISHPALGGARLSAPAAIMPFHDVAAFDCGNVDLNGWLVHRSRASEGRTARTFVVSNDNRVVGYYCMAAGSVVRAELPKGVARNTPESVPILVIGRLAVDLKQQGKGIGSGLLKDAMLRAINTADSIGVRAVVVHAINEDAIKFYLKYRFVHSPLNQRTLVLPMEVLKANL